MTRGAGTGDEKSGGCARVAASTSAAGGVTPSAMMIAAGCDSNRRSMKPETMPASYAPMTWMLLGWVRLRWPISAAAAAASRRTAVPPSRPATHARDSASRLSSCSRATLTCSIRMPGGDQLVERFGVRRARQQLAQRLVGEHLGQLGEDLQVLLGGLFRHEQHEDEVDRVAVGGVERPRLGGAQEGAAG